MHKITKYQKLFIHAIQRDGYTFHTVDNNCEDIKVGDRIEIDGIEGTVESLEWFMKSFGIKGENVSVLVNSDERHGTEGR